MNLSTVLSAVVLCGIAGGAALAADPVREPTSSPLPGWGWGKPRGEYFKYKDEKPLFTITAENVDKYADKLTPGQIALIKSRPGYAMPVYPTHRDCALPSALDANTKKNVGSAKLDASGDYLVDGTLPGVLFSEPKNGSEVIWNYLTRYRGAGIQWTNVRTALSPAPGREDWIVAVSNQWTYYPWGGVASANPAQVGDTLNAIEFAYTQPAALAGQALAQRFFFSNNSTDTYYYFPGQRRVRRMPSYSYDAPQIGFENNYTIDDPYLFNGAIDRFDWKIIGHKQVVVPYNSFGMFAFNRDFNDVAKPQYLAADARRYEIHDVVQLEATVKAGVRHVASRKEFYVDPDSWLLLIGEDYDGQNKLWKVGEGYAAPIWEIGGACDVEPFAKYDLLNGRYVVDQGPIGAGTDMKYYPEASVSQLKDSYYSSETLRSISER